MFYNNANVTINLVPALVGGGLLLLLLVPLLALLFQPAEAGASGYGAPAAEYGAPAPAYGAPEYRSVSNSIGPNHSCPSISFCGHSLGWFFLTSRVGGIIDNGWSGVIMLL